MAAWPRLALPFGVALRAQQGGFRAPGHRRRDTTWSTCARLCAPGHPATRSRRDRLFGPRRALRSSPITPDGDEPPPDSMWVIRTQLPGTLKNTVGKTSGWRTWIAYGVKQSQNA